MIYKTSCFARPPYGQALLCAALLGLSACASRPGSKEAHDPFEGFNRGVYKFNTAVDNATLKPAAKAYNAVVPAPARRGVDNAVQNLQEPWTMVNSLLQGKISNMFNSLGRFLVNSTFGFAGFADRASKWDMTANEEDFGQTLGVWGVPEGPYIMLPFLGPSNGRDFTGVVVEFFGDPVSYGLKKKVSRYASWGRKGVEIGNFRTKALKTVDPVLDSSDDPYVTLRSAYRQQRVFEVSDGKVIGVDASDDPFEQPETTTPETPPATPAQPQELQSLNSTAAPNIDDSELAADARAKNGDLRPQ